MWKRVWNWRYKDDELLFGPESILELDSMDALQISMVLHKKYGLKLQIVKNYENNGFNKYSSWLYRIQMNNE